jgi:hypothetical protein
MSAPHFELEDEEDEEMPEKVGIITGGASGMLSAVFKLETYVE